MNGTYQHRIFFIYLDLFTVDEDGIWIKNQFYPWCELKSLQQSKELAVLKFYKKTKLIQTRRFRKKGERLTLSFWGKNETFEKFRSFIWSKIRENERGPEYRRLQTVRDELVKRIELTTDERKLGNLVRDYKVCVSQLNNLDRKELENIQKNSHRIKLQTLIVIMTVVGTVIWAMIA